MAVHTELLHEQAVLFAVFLYSHIAHDDFFIYEYLNFLFTVKIAWGVLV